MKLHNAENPRAILPESHRFCKSARILRSCLRLTANNEEPALYTDPTDSSPTRAGVVRIWAFQEWPCQCCWEGEYIYQLPEEEHVKWLSTRSLPPPPPPPRPSPTATQQHQYIPLLDCFVHRQRRHLNLHQHQRPQEPLLLVILWSTTTVFVRSISTQTPDYSHRLRLLRYPYREYLRVPTAVSSSLSIAPSLRTLLQPHHGHPRTL